jgi:two-component system chemotaxis sensor kinase CheA
MGESESQDEMQEIIQDFMVETQEILEGLDQHFVNLEENPSNRDLLNEIFRAVHSVKGSAGFLGYNRLVEVAHNSENVLNRLRQGEMQTTPETIDIVLESVDVLKALLGEIKNKTPDLVDTMPIRRKLELLLSFAEEIKGPPSGSSQESPPPQSAVSIQEPITVPPLVAETPITVPSDRREAASLVTAASSAILPVAAAVVELEKQVMPSSSEPSDAIGKPASVFSPPPDGVNQNVDHKESDQSIRVDTARLDQVMNLVGELVLGRNRLMKIGSELEELYETSSSVRSLSETVAQLNLVTTDLQLAVMKTRMQPIRKVFNKFPRMVRDMVRKVGKKVNLELSGEDTELDKSVIEEIGDPLIHLIRNSIDHGIESPEVRKKVGKSEEGCIRLAAYQEGDAIIVKIEDDGKGIDPAVIERKAFEKGLLKDQNSRMSDKDLINLIFLPGFSTAEKVSDISGRGVGMDVVKTNVGRMNGIIDIDSKVGLGTRFTIRIPLTLAIIHVLMVKVEEEIYAIPLSSIVETVRIMPEEIKKVDGQEVLCLRDQVIPLVGLGDELGVIPGESKKQWIYVVLVAFAEKRVGVVVDTLCHQEEVVIKPIGEYLSGIKEVSGATITGDGKVGLILDIAALIQKTEGYAVV